MNLNITLPSWLDMDQPAEAAIAAIILFLAAGYFLRGRSEAPADAPAAAAAPPPQPAVAPAHVHPAPAPPPAPHPYHAPAPTPSSDVHASLVEIAPPIDPAFQSYLSFLSGIRDPAANSPEAVQRAAHWSD